MTSSYVSAHWDCSWLIHSQNLATVKLAKLNGSTSTVDSASTLPQSPTSTSSLDHSPDKVAFSTATRVSRLEPATPPNHSPSSSVAYPGRQTATPVLFKVDLADDARVAGSPSWRKRVKVPDSGVGSDCSLSSVWIDLEDALALYVLYPAVLGLMRRSGTRQRSQRINQIGGQS